MLGAQGQLWTEYMPTPKQVEYQAFPRMSALAEVVWSQREAKNYPAFLERLARHLERLKVLDVNYRPLDGWASGDAAPAPRDGDNCGGAFRR